MIDNLDEWARVREDYNEYRNNGLIGFSGEWSWYNEETAEQRVQEWLTFLDLIRASGTNLRGKQVLDVGCGDGMWLRWVLDLGVEPADAIGVDLLDWRVQTAQRLAPNIDFRIGSADALDIADTSMDLVRAALVFSSVRSASARSALSEEMARVVRPGGYIYLYDLFSGIGDSGPLRADRLFPGWPTVARDVVPHGSLSRCFRPLRGIGPMLARALRGFGYPPSHFAALLGPKPEIPSVQR